MVIIMEIIDIEKMAEEYFGLYVEKYSNHELKNPTWDINGSIEKYRNSIKSYLEENEDQNIEVDEYENVDDISFFRGEINIGRLFLISSNLSLSSANNSFIVIFVIFLESLEDKFDMFLFDFIRDGFIFISLNSTSIILVFIDPPHKIPSTTIKNLTCFRFDLPLFR